MKEIIFNAYEINDLFRILDYAKEKKFEDCNKNRLSPTLLKMDLDKISTIRKRLNGIKSKEDYVVQSTKYDDEMSRSRKGLEE